MTPGVYIVNNYILYLPYLDKALDILMLILTTYFGAKTMSSKHGNIKMFWGILNTK